MSSLNAEKWLEGTHEELDALHNMGVYELIPRSTVPNNKTILDVKLVYMQKRDMWGEVVRNKVHYCIKGYRQIYGETILSPLPRLPNSNLSALSSTLPPPRAGTSNRLTSKQCSLTHNYLMMRSM